MNTPLLRQLLLTETELPPTPSCLVTSDNEILPQPCSSVAVVADSVGNIKRTKRSKDHKVQYCSAINCKRNRVDNPKLSFFKYPKDEERCRMWKVNSRRADIQKKTAEQLNRGSVLCAMHFQNSQFSCPTRKHWLKKDAVPTLFDIQNKPPLISSKRPTPKPRQYISPKKRVKCTALTNSTSQPPEANISIVEDNHSSALLLKTSKLKELSNKLERQRKKIKRLQSKPKAKSSREEINTIKDMSSKYLNKYAHNFFCKQLYASQRRCRGSRYSARDKSFALSLLHASPKAYMMLQKVFLLPSIQTLRNTMKKIQIYPGFPPKLLSAFKCKVDSLAEAEKVCVLVFDEIALKKSVTYNIERDYIEGLEDFADFIETSQDKPAGYATVFMARGLIRSWKQPFGYVLTESSIKSNHLDTMLDEAINHLQSIGLTVKALVCDQGPNNMAMLRRKNISVDTPFFYHHHNNEDKIFVFYDSPHLLKNTRNNLLNHDFFFDAGVASWSTIVKFFEQDRKLESLKFALNLTNDHINPSGFVRQRVYLAAQILSHSVSKGIDTMRVLGILPPDTKATSVFCSTFDSLFNIFNTSAAKTSAAYRHPINKTSSHLQKLTEMYTWLNSLEYGTENNKKLAKRLPCISGWLSNIKALNMFIEDIVGVLPGVDYILTNRLNQDCLENLFSTITGKGGQRDSLDPQQFRYSLRQVMVERILIVSTKSNCKDDVDHLLINMSSDSHQQNYTQVTSDVDTEPRYLVNIAKSCQLNDIVQFENVAAYVGGYMLMKIIKTNIVCDNCIEILTDQSSTQQRHLVLIQQKQIKGTLKGGLKSPSKILTSAVLMLEAVFQTHFKISMRRRKIRMYLKQKSMEHIQGLHLKSTECHCKILELLVSIFVTVRIHHELKKINEEIKNDSRQRNRKHK